MVREAKGADRPRERARRPEKAKEAEQEASEAPAAAEEAPDAEDSILNRTALSLAGHALPPRKAAAKTLAQFTQLRRLDLSDMQASDDAPNGLEDLRILTQAVSLSKKHAKKHGSTALADRLTWLNVSNNAELGQSDYALDGIDELAALHGTLPAGLSALSQLKALVVSHNAIAGLPQVMPHMPELNTLVLSNNALTTLPKTLPASLPALKKLSISHNQLTDGGALPDFSVCAHLREVRLCGNKALQRLPAHIQKWGKGVDGGAPGLALLDVSDCGLDDFASIAPLLKASDALRRGLSNLCLKGNGVAAEEEYQDKILDAYPGLRILDNVRLHPKKSQAEEQEAPKDEPVEPTKGERKSKAPEAAQAERSEPTERKKPKKDRFFQTKPVQAPEKPEQAEPKRKRKDRAEEPARETDKKARKHAEPAPEATPEPEPADAAEVGKKVRKRSGRGPKKHRGEDAEHARLLARAGPAPDEPIDEPMDEPMDEPEVDAPAASEPPSTRSKKTRRKKKEAHTVELTMDVPAPEAAPAPPPPRAPSPAPEPVAAKPDTGVVDVVEVRSKPRTAPLSMLARRDDDDLGSW